MRTDDFDYALPPELIAQEPAPERSQSRLLVLDRHSGTIEHARFADLGRFLRRGDLLVANRTRVIRARLHGRRRTGGSVELLLLGRRDGPVWEVMARPGRKLRPGEPIEIDGADLCAEPVERNGDGTWTVRFDGPGDVDASLRAAGEVPLPPYIRGSRAPEDRYQTVYADREGSVAAPTAGLHFSQPLLQHLTESGIGMEMVTLHVGAGTFKPVTADRIEDHRMHAEWGEVTPRTAAAVNETRRSGGRVIGVGTTTTRLLESAWTGTALEPFTGETDRFIYPGYQFGVIDGLVTNFHLPRSTLLMLVSAFAGRENVLRAYGVAVEERYRFFSFGDAMLII